MRRLLALGLATALALGGAASAQDLPFGEAPDLVSELVVKARTPGPAWWKVSDADTTVWVLGSPGLLPKSVDWDDSALKRRLTGANRLILPPREKASIVGSVALLAALKKTLLDPRPAAQRMPPDLYERLREGWNRGDRNTYVSLGIGPGGVLIEADRGPLRAPGAPKSVDTPDGQFKSIILALVTMQLADAPLGKLVDEPATRADALAASLKVPRSRAGIYDEMAAFKAGLALPEPAQQACLAGALDMLDAQEARVAARRARAQAWAQGDVPAALGRSDRFDMAGACPTPPAVKAMAARNIPAAVSAIQGEMRRRGHAVAVVDLSDLLQTGGVLDQLRAKGLTIVAPDSLAD